MKFNHFLLIITGMILIMFLGLKVVHAQEIIKYKYDNGNPEAYGIFCGTEINYHKHFSNRLYVSLGSCYDNGLSIPLYRSKASKAISERNNNYIHSKSEINNIASKVANLTESERKFLLDLIQ